MLTSLTLLISRRLRFPVECLKLSLSCNSKTRSNFMYLFTISYNFFGYFSYLPEIPTERGFRTKHASSRHERCAVRLSGRVLTLENKTTLFRYDLRRNWFSQFMPVINSLFNLISLNLHSC